MPTLTETLGALKNLLASPSLKHARALEAHLMQAGYERKVFARINQKSSIEAASESDRGIAERLANAFDASLTAARIAAGITKSDRTLSPRNTAQRFLAPKVDRAEWTPAGKQITFGPPSIQFWREDSAEKHRFRRYNPESGLATVRVSDNGIGISRADMPTTILDLNSGSKLQIFEAIGQFGHGGSSSLAFCESCLILTQPRCETREDFYWTLIFPEHSTDDSKQPVTRRWFSDLDGLPFTARQSDFPELTAFLPGTSAYHFGYMRGDWINKVVGPAQNNPWGRLGRLFFSYPLPFEIQGELARADEGHKRTIRGAYFRLIENEKIVEYRTGEKSETLVVDCQAYGTFSVFAFVLRSRDNVRDYVDRAHPVILTLNGQNHGETTANVLTQANLPELATSTILEVRLDQLDSEALSEIISNSREQPKNSAFYKALMLRVREALEADDALAALERQRQEEKAKQSSAELNQKIEKFLSSIISNAAGGSGSGTGSEASGRTREQGPTLPEIPAGDPPQILEFVKERFSINEGARVFVKFKSDARPPKYSFHGDNQRCFASLEGTHTLSTRLSIVGLSDINNRGYGSISITVKDDPQAPITEGADVATLTVRLQSADGRVLETRATLAVSPKPAERERPRKPEVKTQINFFAPEGADPAMIARLLGEESVASFDQASHLAKYQEALQIGTTDCTYWGERTERDGNSILLIEINGANAQLRKLLESCKDGAERSLAKERYVRDVALDCYQHAFRLNDVPENVLDTILTDPRGDERRAAEIHLNHDKALRIALHERETGRK